ncbi:hypothetical protein MJO29_009699 [Puccinia striiformis f. sp. tritici]|nr:hypothetical protein MJO29_009699 [Puccinia striiformis f. sp. tritici]
MSDPQDQPVDNSEPSALQQISELRGEFQVFNSTLMAFIARFPGDSSAHDTPPHIPQPQPQPQPQSQPPPQPTVPQFHDQFTFSHSRPPTNHHPSASQQFPHPFPSAAPSVPHSQYAEHQKLPEVWFSGESSQLGPFLKDIRNFFHLRAVYFPSETRMIVWVSLHFGFRPFENQKGQSRSQNWYYSLIVENARLQGKFSPYADLERLAFLLPALSSWEAFENSLISYFGAKHLAETARATLDACRQGSMSVEEYNTQFGSLAYLVDMSDGDRVARYINGLNLNVRKQVNGQAWRAARNLKEKMDLVVEGAKDLDMLSRLSDPHSAPSKSKPAPPHQPPLYHHPHSFQRASDAMDIDVATTHPNQRPINPFIALFRRVCMAQRVCFRCLKRTSPPDHTTPSNCPNGRTSFAEKQQFVERYRSAPPVQVSAALVLPPSSNAEIFPASSTSTPSGDFGYDEVYEDVVNADLATVKVQLDTSRSGRIMVPVSFQVSPSKSVVASVLVDTGAMANFVNKRFVDENQLLTRLRKTPIRCIGFDGNEGVGGLVTHDWVGRIHVSSVDSATTIPFPSSFGVTCLGSVDAIFGLPWLDRQTWTASGSSSGGHRFILGSAEVFVVDAFSLGEELEGKVPVSSISPVFSLPPQFQQFADVFRPQDNCTLPPHRSMDISIKLREGAVPPFGGLYNLSVDEMSQLKDYVDENLNKGFIRVSSSPAAAPIFFVRVPGKKPRPCVDYRGLNSMTVRDSYPIPILGQLLNQLQGCKFFTKIDLKAAFNLLRVAEGDEWKTAFRTPWGLFEYLVMPFGLSNAPACFQRFIQHVLREFLHISCFVYIDDILIFSRTREEHTNHVLQILKCLQAHQLFASPKKCSFYAHHVSFLGFVISSDGIRMDPDKLSTVVDWPYPETVCHLRKFLGFTNFYRKFIDRFSEVSAPLTELTKNGVDVGQGLKAKECLSSFSHLKSCFTRAPLLQHFDFAKKRVLFVDSSKYALAAVLCQPGVDGVLCPVSFLSRKLTPRESVWQVHDQELFAVVHAFQEWRAWLIDTTKPVLVMSDHANLRYFMDSQKLSNRQARWAAFLVSFHFVIQHVSGKANPADPATRRPDFVSGDESNEHHRTLLSGEGSELRLTDSSSDADDDLELAELTISDTPQDSAPLVSESLAPPETGIDLTDPVFCQPTHRLKQMLTEAYRREPPVADVDDESPLVFEHGFWWLKDRIFVPPGLRPFILQSFHDDISAGHVGSLETLQNITRSLTWPGIRKDIIQYTKSCLSCQRAKHSNQFVVDHFSKAVHLIPACETWSAEAFAACFLDRFIRYHGLPNKIVSDRGPIFVSKFWTEVQRLLCIKPAPSTAYHPRTDGQTERTNQTIETFIRHYISHHQDDWASMLPLAEIVFNSTVSASTGYSPFFAQYAFHPRLNTLADGSLVPAAHSLVESLTSIQDELKKYMTHAKEVQKEYFDKRVREAHPFKVGDWVWLLRRNIASTWPSPKLDFKKLGPFRIEAVIGPVAYRLTLPPELKRLHPVFHTALLLPFIDPAIIPWSQGPIHSSRSHNFSISRIRFRRHRINHWISTTL